MLKQFFFKQFSLAQACSLNVKIVPFQTIQLNTSTQFSSIWPLNRTLSGVTTPSQIKPESDSNKDLLGIFQNSSIIEASWSDCLVSYPEHSWVAGKSYSSAEMHSTASAD